MTITLDGFAADLFNRLEPYAHRDTENGDPVALICRAIGGQFRDVDLVVRDADDGTPGWARLFDLEQTATNAPWALGWVAQIAGARIPDGMAPDVAVTYIREVAGHRRGTPGAMRAAVYATLDTPRTPEQAVRIVERTTSAYTFTVIVSSSETPDAAASEAAARAQKPAGLVMTFIVSDAPIIDEGAETIDSVAATIDDAIVADVT